MKSVICIYLAIFSFTYIKIYGQNNGFTNRKEAKNLTKNGLKEGKWVEDIGEIIDDSTSYTLVIYKAGKREGLARSYYENGILLSESPYVNDEINGVKRWYHSNGNLELELPHVANELNGLCKKYYKNGKLKVEASYLGLKNTDSYKEYYENRQLMKSINYTKLGEKIGVSKFYYQSGNIKSETIHLNDSTNVAKTYSEDGKLIYETSYKKKPTYYLCKTYNPNGKITSETWYKCTLGDLEDNFYDIYNNYYLNNGPPPYESDHKEGIEKLYTSDGELISETAYKNNLKNGLEKMYTSDGKLISETAYKNNLKNGLEKMYYPNGIIKSETEYQNGWNVNEKLYDKSGKPIH